MHFANDKNHAFNRTSVELKLIVDDEPYEVWIAFNRTSVELKLIRSFLVDFQIFAFNRTSVELKLHPTWGDVHLVNPLLIEPVWN